MKIIAAPNGFKGSMDAFEAARSILLGVRRVDSSIKVVEMPVADGGDGLAQILTRALGGEMLSATVSGPIFQDISASFGYIKASSTCVVEMAMASGLALLGEKERDPESTTTFGTGQLIKQCLDLNADKIVVGLGGSATCDGGIGAAAALGYKFYDRLGKELLPVGGNLIHLASIDAVKADRRIEKTVIEAVCDVSNTLTGPNGASYVYSPQKGADREQVKRLDDGLCNLAEVMKKDLAQDVGFLPGSGAAGGLGAGVSAFLGGRLRKGIDLVLDIIGLSEVVRDADLVITGEGRMDFQTKFDKAPAGVARVAKEAGVPCVAICGSMGENIQDLHDIGIDAVISLCHGPLTLAEAVRNGEQLLSDTTEQVVRLFLKGVGR